ncbi:STOREKEEPER protein-like [Nicotiana tabacum]|uniref:Mediator-associated protein 1-like n=2 Tax=Nicotiana TaxID=4085 RepID=A0A1S4AZB4_TOBAC|nr:PREDICTED: mediator-associated protein 1-like [Nicotiana sylvestris]XP_016481909.1 PREDICTED: mediator-associated protein 1-like [Nicotiana tabacum]
MAPKSKSRLVDQPPSASSSEEQDPQQAEESQEEEEEAAQSEEEEEEESGEDESDDEEEPKTAPPLEKKPTSQKPLQTPQNKPQSSSSESGTEDGSGSDSDSESGQSQPSPSASDFTVKPSVPTAKSPSKPFSKRPQETQQQQALKEKHSRPNKKPKISEEDSKVSEEKKSAATTPSRLWSDEDQLAILKGMADFKAQKGSEPNATDMSAFHDFIKGKLQVEVSKSQVTDKLRRLKKKFLTNVKISDDPVFSKPHDYLMFEFSKKIWGDAGTSNTNGINEIVNNGTNGKAKKTVDVVKRSTAEPKKSAKVSTLTKLKDDEKPKEDEKRPSVKEVDKEDVVVKVDDRQDFRSKYPNLAASFSLPAMSSIFPNGVDIFKENMSLIASDKAKVLEEKWKKLHDDEDDLMLKRLDLIREHYKLVVDARRGN